MLDLTTGSSFPAYSPIPGLATEALCRAVKVNAGSPANTFNVFFGMDAENTNSTPTYAIEAAPGTTAFFQCTRSSGFANVKSVAGCTFIDGYDATANSFNCPGRTLHLIGYLLGKSEDSTITWSGMTRTSVTRDGTDKQWTWPIQIPSGFTLENVYVVTETDTSPTIKIELCHISVIIGAEVVDYTATQTASGGLTFTPVSEVVCSDPNASYYLRVKIKASGGTYLYMRNPRITYTGTGA
jgi:hypothetical protein